MSDRRPRRQGAKCFRVCIECKTRRQIPWHLRLEADHQDDTYVCKWCKPRERGPRYVTFDQTTYSWNWNLLHRYGLTPEQYEASLAEQGGVCAICKKPPKKNRLHVDHDHGCDQEHDPKLGCVKCFRGLLCVGCNSRLEWLEEFYEPALAYLKRVRRS